jgi:hypothetical protein
MNPHRAFAATVDLTLYHNRMNLFTPPFTKTVQLKQAEFGRKINFRYQLHQLLIG